MHAEAAGGPIDKLDLRISNFNIAEAYSRALAQTSAQTFDERRLDLDTVTTDLRHLGGVHSTLDATNIKETSNIMKTNVYFKKFLLRHDRSLERIAEKTPHFGELQNFLTKRNVYR